jgi:hypothetical protein
MNSAAQLDAQLKAAGIPIAGVSIGTATDKATWSVQFLDTATAAQHAQGQAIIDAYDIPAEELAWQWYLVRTQRDKLLYSCDWTQVADAAIAAEDVAAWTTYRQALRAVPQTQTDPYAIVWPTPPFVLDPMPL